MHRPVLFFIVLLVVALIVSVDRGASVVIAQPADPDEPKTVSADVPAAQTKAATQKAVAKKNATAKQKKEEEGEDDDDAPLSVFMQQKLDASSEILKGLMIEDYKLIQKNADVLLKMSRQERWRASNDMMYLQNSNQFRNTVEELRTKAIRKSTDGASLAWVNVTMSCIQCHNWVRNIMLADLNAEAGPGK